MYNVSFISISDKNDLSEYHQKFCKKIGYEVPIDYFKLGKCYGLYVKGQLVAGFCLVKRPAYELRSLKQVPSFVSTFYTEEFIYDIAEFTGYFIEDKRYAFRFTVNLLKTVLSFPAKYYVYSYPLSQKGLSQYYAKGKPIKIYSGIPKKLEGHTDKMEPEHVEVLTKWGIFMVFWHRTKKYLRL